MNVARLVVQAKGGQQVITLRNQVVTGGRAPENTLMLPDPRVSRFHFRVEPREGGYQIVDVGSQNGILRGGRRVRTEMLEDGALYQVGAARIRFEVTDDEDEDEPLADDRTELDGDAGAASDERTLSIPRPQGRFEPPDSRKPLRRLAEVSRLLNTAPSDESVFRVLVDAAVELTGSERGFLLQSRKGGLEFAAARNIDHEDLESPEFQLSWSIAIRVGQSGEGVLLVNAAEDDRYAAIDSVESLALRSVLCLPIGGSSGILGVIYLDNPLRKGAYTEETRELVEVLADHAGIALHNRQMVTEIRSRRSEVEDLNHQLQQRIDEQDDQLRELRGGTASDPLRDFHGLIGNSARMEELKHLLRKVSMTDFPVLIHGESGTGKELVARSLHVNSQRSDHGFVSLNCAAVPENLLESELFGHLKGAFTGADRDKPGLFRVAHKGTLFLDEVSETSPAMQSRLLRALQEGEIRPVGGKEPIKVDVRVIAASNQDLGKMVKDGLFREDLYYRLKVLPVRVPALRERREDIPALIQTFFERHAGKAPTIDVDALDTLCSYGWPGNVRELENEVKRLIVLARDGVDQSSLSPHILEAGEMRVGRESSFQDLNALVEAVETTEIRKALSRTDGNKTKAAELLGISRFTLQRKLEKYQLLEELD